MSNNTPDTFKYGSIWLRADFHLHTKADGEFQYDNKDNDFVSDYVSALKNQDTSIGVIANHNKFDVNEFKALSKKARKKEIFLLPGVELSVNDGANGIHTLVIFSNQWLEEGQDYINQFLNIAFEGKTLNQYEYQNCRSSLDLVTTLKKLEGYHRDFFVIFAHVEQNSGLWNELDGGRLEELSQNKVFKRRTLAFQKVRTRDMRDKVKQWFENWYPAEVEGSDCKSITDIGKGERSFLKQGAFSFDAVKFALTNKNNRVSTKVILYKHSHIKQIRFTGGTLNGQVLHFSPELNTMIGIRGSGKSSILEVIRYALDIPFGEKAGDKKYKQDLVGFTLGSGGKVEIDAIDRHGQLYTIRRVWKEPYSEILIDGKLQPGVSIRETVLCKPIYFGQKDLSASGEGFEKDLVDKLLGSKINEARHNIVQQKKVVVEAIERLLKVSSVQEQITEQRQIEQDTQHRLKFYTEHGVEQKLQKRLDFDTDIRVIDKGVKLVKSFVADIENLLAQYEDDIRNFTGYSSRHNVELFDEFYKHYEIYISFTNQVKTWLSEQTISIASLSRCQSKLSTIRKGMVEEFAKIERELAMALKDNDQQNISSDEFLQLNKKLIAATQLISIFEKQSKQEDEFHNTLLEELRKLNDLWLIEFNIIKKELSKVGSDGSSISIVSEYKEDKESYLTFMKDMFRGSGIRENTFSGITQKYLDFIAIYKDFEKSKALFGSNPENFTDLFMKNLKSLLTYQVPNKFTIIYRNKTLQHHSLGQRASALILFVLSQRENDVIIIDQPEDDLDNQTIYEDVIKLICKVKHDVQFIFATHNPNIPVLGDAELVHACSFVDKKIEVSTGSVDNAETQKIIVNIMEGGQEAFSRRKEIYQIWKP